MKNNITELVFILDKSGSMAGLTDDTIGGFNSLIQKQKKETGVCHVTTVLFNDSAVTVHDRLPLAEVPAMTEKDYCPGGCTALLDALGGTIRHIAHIHRYARPEDVPEQTLFVITTDGMENASHRYTAERVREMIRHEQEKYGWEFLFLGANIDALETASRYGIAPGRAVNYIADEDGTDVLYDSLNEAVLGVRTKCCVAPDWADKIRKDYHTRK